MSTARFSPGPWTVSEEEGIVEQAEFNEGYKQQIVSAIEIPFDFGGNKTTEANLTLCAAATEMYEALQEADRLYSNYALLAQAPEAGPWINKVRAALAKAVPK